MNRNQITKKQLEILLLLYRFRFLNTKHFQQLLHHKDPHRIKVWLKHLTDIGYINREYSKDTYDAKITSALYCLTTKARTLLKKHDDCATSLLNRVYREKNSSQRFKDHCIFLADLFILLDKQSKEDNSVLEFLTKVDLFMYDLFPEKLPDAYIVSKNEGYFLDLIDEGTPRYAIRSRIKEYFAYADEKTWEHATKAVLPPVILICPNTMTQRFLMRYIPKILEESYETITFYLTTKKMIQTHGFTQQTWQKIDGE